MKLLYPDYNNCIANLACSVLKYFGVQAPNKTLAMADELLKKQYKNVVVLLLDGMGRNIIEKNLDSDGFFRSNLKGIYTSVFPPTTVSATTSIDSGLFPNQHSWLGWECYYKELDKNVTVFNNTDINGNQAAEFNAAWTYCPYLRVADRIKDTGNMAFEATPFSEPYPQSFSDICMRIKHLCSLDGRKYIYAYWNEPDSIMHRTGCFSKKSKSILRELECQTKELSKDLSETLLIITADHGQINSDSSVITDYPDVMECLLRMPSIEPRALNFFVKKGMEKQFEAVFNKHFGDKFILLCKEEAIAKELFGSGENNKRFNEMLGDYIAIATSDLAIYNKDNKFIGVHAGLTEDEMEIPFIAIEK